MKVKNMAKSMLCLTLAILVFVAGQVSGSDLCSEASCQCTPNELLPDLQDVTCTCSEKQVLNIGPPASSSNGDSGKPKHNAVSLPANAAQLSVTGCHHVEMFGRSLNHLLRLKNITITDSHKVVLHQRLYEVRAGNGGTTHLNSFSLENIRDLKISGQAFEGMSVDGSFILKSVSLERIPPLAFNFDAVGEFNILDSKFERVPLWGFKLRRCREFNVLEKSQFSSLATGAIHVSCHKFMLAYSKFGTIQDSAFNVRFGLADIQGNLFDTLVGKPFAAFQILSTEELTVAELDESQIGFIFRENQFVANPTLPPNSLAFPVFEALTANPAHQVIIEENHFVCQCGRMDWLLGAINFNFDVENVSSFDFVKKLHDSAGKCLDCNSLSSCKMSEKSFKDFSSNVYLERTINGPLKCSATRPATTTPEPIRDIQIPPEDSKRVMAGTGNTISFPLVTMVISAFLSLMILK